MHPENVLRNAESSCATENETGSPRGPTDRLFRGSLIDIAGSRHRIAALVDKRVLAFDLRTHHIYLTQDADGSIQLPTVSLIRQMIDSGQAVPATELDEPSATERMRAQIDMLDAAEVRQGDKAIWIFLTTHWTAELEARFGRHDQPWKIRRWRAALRRASECGLSS